MGATLDGGEGNDTLFSLGVSTLDGGSGNDLLVIQDIGSTAEFVITASGVANGGEGDDSLTGGPGDTLIGGEGRDSFAVATIGEGAPTIITDFNPAEDRLTIVYYVPEGQDPALVTPSSQQVGDDTEVLFDGDVVARVLGTQVADVNFLFFVRSDALLA